MRIDRDGWRVETRAIQKFVRGAGFGELPLPVRGGRLHALQKLLGLSDKDFLLVIAFLINALKPKGPYICLHVEGEQGSGKSVTCEIIKKIIDPNMVSRLRLPENDRDLMIQAKEYRHLNFDNTSGMKADMSDVLCTLSTTGAIAVRKLYTDGELHVLSYARSFVLNGIFGFVTRPDLMERAIPLMLPALPQGGRKTEAELMAAFEEMLPSVLGVLYDAVAMALRDFTTIAPPMQLRMADAARWIKAAEPALGLDGSLIDAIVAAQSEFVVDRVNDEPLVVQLREIAARGPFEGHIGDLFKKLDPDAPGLPRTPSRLSHHLRRLAPAMAKAGVQVTLVDRDRRGQRVRITSDAPPAKRADINDEF